jgi:hypothetical protein
MIKIQAPFRLVEPLPAYLSASSLASFIRPGRKQIILNGFDIRFETGGKTYKLSTDTGPDHRSLCSRGLGFARQVVALPSGISLEQQILLPNAGDAVAVSWRLFGEKIAPVRLTATPIFSSVEPTSSEIFTYDLKHDSGRLTWLPFPRACKIIADTNGRCAEPPLTTESNGEQSITVPSAFVFNLGRWPSLLHLSVELPTNSSLDPLMGAFLADLAIPKREQHGFLSAA